MKRVIWLRLLLILQTLLGCLASFKAEGEPVYALRIVGGLPATLAVCAMAGLTLLALADLILSETESRLWTAVRRRRWAVWLLMACGHGVQTAVALWFGFVPWVAANYLLVASFCLVVAVLDVHYRYCDGMQRQADTGGVPLDSPMRRKWHV